MEEGGGESSIALVLGNPGGMESSLFLKNPCPLFFLGGPLPHHEIEISPMIRGYLNAKGRASPTRFL